MPNGNGNGAVHERAEVIAFLEKKLESKEEDGIFCFSPCPINGCDTDYPVQFMADGSYGICRQCEAHGDAILEELWWESVVVPPDREGKEGNNTTKVDRYTGREVDIDTLLSLPRKPTPWRCEGFVADKTLTILAGASGARKSQLAIFLALGVAEGKTVGHIRCHKGSTLILDGEMGRDMYIDRLRQAGLKVKPPNFYLLDGMGLDLSRPGDLAWLGNQITKYGAKFVVLDSLRRLAPSKRENDSDDMAPMIGSLAKLARDTDSAILLIHHSGDNDEKLYRGSTAIPNQTDALFGLIRAGDKYRLTCKGWGGKVRYAEEPNDTWLSISMTDVQVTDRPKNYKTDASVKGLVQDQILLSLKENPSKTKSAVAERIGRERDDNSFIAAFKGLENDGRVSNASGVWKVVPLVAAGEQNGSNGSVVVAPTLREGDDHNTLSPYDTTGDFA